MLSDEAKVEENEVLFIGSVPVAVPSFSVDGANDRTSEQRLFEVHVACIQGWFLRASFLCKRQFVYSLLDKCRDNWTLIRVIEAIGYMTTKDVIYTVSHQSWRHAYDAVPLDDCRELDHSALRAAIKRDVGWFSCLDKREQLEVIVSFLRLGGGALVREARTYILRLLQGKREVSEELKGVTTGTAWFPEGGQAVTLEDGEKKKDGKDETGKQRKYVRKESEENGKVRKKQAETGETSPTAKGKKKLKGGTDETIGREEEKDGRDTSERKMKKGIDKTTEGDGEAGKKVKGKKKDKKGETLRKEGGEEIEKLEEEMETQEVERLSKAGTTRGDKKSDSLTEKMKEGGLTKEEKGGRQMEGDTDVTVAKRAPVGEAKEGKGIHEKAVKTGVDGRERKVATEGGKESTKLKGKEASTQEKQDGKGRTVDGRGKETKEKDQSKKGTKKDETKADSETDGGKDREGGKKKGAKGKPAEGEPKKKKIKVIILPKGKGKQQTLDQLQFFPVRANYILLSKLSKAAQKNMMETNQYWDNIVKTKDSNAEMKKRISKEINKCQASIGPDWNNPDPFSGEVAVDTKSSTRSKVSKESGMNVASLGDTTRRSLKSSRSGRSDTDLGMEAVCEVLKRCQYEDAQRLAGRNPYAHLLKTVCLSKEFCRNRLAAYDGSSSILALSCGSTINFLSLHTGKTMPPSLSGHNGSITVVRYHPDGHEIFTGSTDATVRSWDACGFSTMDTFSGHTGTVTDVCVRSKILASASLDKAIKVWLIAFAQCVLTIQETLPALCLVMDDKNLYVGFSKGVLRQYDVSTGSPLKEVTAHQRNVSGLVLEAPFLISCGLEGQVRLWDHKNLGPHCLLTMVHKSPVRCIAFRSMLVFSGCCNGSLVIWCARTGARLKVFEVNKEERPIVNVICFEKGKRSMLLVNSETSVDLYQFYDDEVQDEKLKGSWTQAPRKTGEKYKDPLWNEIKKKQKAGARIAKPGHKEQRLETLAQRQCAHPCLRTRDDQMEYLLLSKTEHNQFLEFLKNSDISIELTQAFEPIQYKAFPRYVRKETTKEEKQEKATILKSCDLPALLFLQQVDQEMAPAAKELICWCCNCFNASEQNFGTARKLEE